MEQKTEASQSVDAPMPSGVEKMTKQELWNWFSRSQRAAAEKKYLEEKFFTVTTGLHSARLCGNPYEIIEIQRKRMAGLEMQMAQMQKGYERKLEKALKAQPAPTEVAQGAQLSGNSGELANKQALENIEQVQGEDSARLEWLFSVMTLAQFCDATGFDVPFGVPTRSLRNLGDWASKEIDRARASAETGGVKS